MPIYYNGIDVNATKIEKLKQKIKSLEHDIEKLQTKTETNEKIITSICESAKEGKSE